MNTFVIEADENGNVCTSDPSAPLGPEDVKDLQRRLAEADAKINEAGFMFAQRILRRLDTDTFAALGMRGRNDLARVALEEYGSGVLVCCCSKVDFFCLFGDTMRR